MKATTVFIFITILGLGLTTFSAHAGPQESNFVEDTANNIMDELNPFDPQIDELLQEQDLQYFNQTGELPFLVEDVWQVAPSCYRQSCPVWLQVVRSTQRAYLFINGVLQHEWLVSTGARGHSTPNFDTHPNGRVYDKYTSKKFPGGDFNGLGNMPYAVFISGGFAVHGTAKSNWPKLGQRASHGCVRVHPDHGFIFNRLVRQYGISGTWITVQE